MVLSKSLRTEMEKRESPGESHLGQWHPPEGRRYFFNPCKPLMERRNEKGNLKVILSHWWQVCERGIFSLPYLSLQENTPTNISNVMQLFGIWLPTAFNIKIFTEVSTDI